jgi:hypothetical protein
MRIPPKRVAVSSGSPRIATPRAEPTTGSRFRNGDARPAGTRSTAQFQRRNAATVHATARTRSEPHARRLKPNGGTPSRSHTRGIRVTVPKMRIQALATAGA